MHTREQRTLDGLNEPLGKTVRLIVVRRDVDQARAETTAALNSSASSGCSDLGEPKTHTHSRSYASRISKGLALVT
jgi:hypothetical protein